jgi:hypothetical protein
MPGSRGDGQGRASIDKLAEWQTRAYPRLRRARESGTPVDDALPVEPALDRAGTLAALEDLKRR